MRRLEAAKTLTLLALVVTSIFFSSQIWRSGPASLRIPAPKAYVHQGHRDLFPMEEALTPSGMYVQDERERWQGVTDQSQWSYKNDWLLLRSALADLELGPESWEETDQALSPPLVRVDFAAGLSWKDWHDIWNGTYDSFSPRTTSAAEEEPWQGPVFSRIEFKQDESGNAVLQFTGEEGRWRVEGASGFPAAELMHQWTAHAESENWPDFRQSPRVEGVQWTDPGVLIPEFTGDRAPLRVEPVVPDPERLARSFFSDMTIVRRGTGVNNVRFYNDGQRLLSVGGYGQVEYHSLTAGTSVRSPDLKSILEDAGRFMVQHGGWPDGLYLWNLTPIFEPGTLDLIEGGSQVYGYQMEWSWQREGLAVVGGPLLNPGQTAIPNLAEPPAPFQFFINTSGIQGYAAVESRVIGRGTERPVLGLERVMEIYLQKRFAAQTANQPLVPLALQDAMPIYYAPPGVPWWEPAWLLITNEGGRIVLDAFDGSLLADSQEESNI